MTTKTTPQRKRMNQTKAADKLFSELVRARDGCCVICGSHDYLQAAHIWSRRYRSQRWRFNNCITLCRRDHLYYTKRPAEWATWCEGHRFCARGICHGHGSHPFDAYTYIELRRLALDAEPERAGDALARLRLLHSEELSK